MKKAKKKDLKQLMVTKAVLQEDLENFLTNKEDKHDYEPFRTVLSCLKNFHYNSEYKGLDELAVEGFQLSTLDFESGFATGAGVGILYSILTLYLYNSDITIPYIPDDLMDEITNFKVKLEELIFKDNA